MPFQNLSTPVQDNPMRIGSCRGGRLRRSVPSPTPGRQGNRDLERRTGTARLRQHGVLARRTDSRTPERRARDRAPERDYGPAVTVLPNPRGEEHCTGTLAYSKRGEFLAASYGRGITIWRVAESKELVRIPKERGALNMVFTDGDRTLVAQELIPVDDQTEPFYFHSRIVRWDVSSGTRLGSVDFGAHHSFRAISPDGRYGVIWVGPADDYDVCDLTTRAKIFVLTGSGNAIFSEDGSKLVWCRKSRIALFEVPSGKELRDFRNRFAVRSARILRTTLPFLRREVAGRRRVPGGTFRRPHQLGVGGGSWSPSSVAHH